MAMVPHGKETLPDGEETLPKIRVGHTNVTDDRQTDRRQATDRRAIA